MPAVALTDFNNFFGAVKFYKAAQAAGVKPILGADFLLLDESGEGAPTQLVLLVKDQLGYANLNQVDFPGLSRGSTAGCALYSQVVAKRV